MFSFVSFVRKLIKYHFCVGKHHYSTVFLDLAQQAYVHHLQIDLMVLVH